MDDKPTCKQCRFMNLTGRAKITARNIAIGGARGYCMCEHPKAYEMFNKVCPRSRSMACFIGFTVPDVTEYIEKFVHRERKRIEILEKEILSHKENIENVQSFLNGEE